MTHKTIINICLTLIALCWTVAIQAQTATVDGINYNLNSDKTAEVTKSNVTGDIVIPEKIIVDGVEYSVTSIGYEAFAECKALTSVKMPSVTSIDNRAFRDCSNLTSVDMPSVTIIGGAAFWACSSLTSVAMPSVTSIGSVAFSNCSIRKLYLPSSLTNFGSCCFSDTREITLAATTPVALEADVLWSYVIIRVPESAVNDYRTAAGWSKYKDQIFSMSDITYYDVTVTAQEKESGLLNALSQDNLGKVVSLKVTGTINGYDIMVIRNKMPNLLYLDLTDATIVANDYEYYTGCHTEDNIIGANMFTDLDKIVSIKLPKNATSIGLYAFNRCCALDEVVLPVKLESIGNHSFYYCKTLKYIDLPPTLKTIGAGAFN